MKKYIKYIALILCVSMSVLIFNTKYNYKKVYAMDVDKLSKDSGGLAIMGLGLSMCGFVYANREAVLGGAQDFILWCKANNKPVTWVDYDGEVILTPNQALRDAVAEYQVDLEGGREMPFAKSIGEVYRWTNTNYTARGTQSTDIPYIPLNIYGAGKFNIDISVNYISGQPIFSEMNFSKDGITGYYLNREGSFQSTLSMTNNSGTIIINGDNTVTGAYSKTYLHVRTDNQWLATAQAEVEVYIDKVGTLTRNKDYTDSISYDNRYWDGSRIKVKDGAIDTLVNNPTRDYTNTIDDTKSTTVPKDESIPDTGSITIPILGDIWDWLKGVWDWLKSAWNTLLATIENIYQSILNLPTRLWDGFIDSMKDLFVPTKSFDLTKLEQYKNIDINIDSNIQDKPLEINLPIGKYYTQNIKLDNSYFKVIRGWMLGFMYLAFTVKFVRFVYNSFVDTSSDDISLGGGN